MRAPTTSYCAHTRHIINSVKRWMKVQGKFKNASVHSGLRTHKAHTVSPAGLPAGRWNVTCVGSIRRKTHGALPRYTANSEHTIGAMEEMSGKVQNANTHNLRRQNHEQAHSSRSVQGPQFNGALDESSRNAQKASTPQPDYRTRWCWSALPCPRCRVPRHAANHEHTQSFSGALDKGSRNVRKASAHSEPG
eukprot:scaffold26994_cov83-Phaeocystis_antarctica.AAC.3